MSNERRVKRLAICQCGALARRRTVWPGIAPDEKACHRCLTIERRETETLISTLTRHPTINEHGQVVRPKLSRTETHRNRN